METIVKAAATVQNDILFVQYSRTGGDIGELYAILLTDTTQPLPFQIQRQTEIQGLTKHLASMSLTTMSTTTSAASKSLAGGADGSDTVPQQLEQSPIDPNAIKSAAVTPAPPFRDLILAVNDENSSADIWHLKAPGRGVPPESPTPSPLPNGDGPGAGAGTGPEASGSLPAPLWTASALPRSVYLDPRSVGVGPINPRGLKEAGFMVVAFSKDDIYSVFLLKIVQRRRPGNAPSSGSLGGSDNSNSSNAAAEQSFEWRQVGNETALYLEYWQENGQDQRLRGSPHAGSTFYITPMSPSLRQNGGYTYAVHGKARFWPTVETAFVTEPIRNYDQSNRRFPPLKEGVSCFTSTPNALVIILGHEVYVNDHSMNVTDSTYVMITSDNSAPSHRGPVIACSGTKDHIIAIIPGSRISMKESQPEVHLFDLKTRLWAKAELTPAPPGTFSDIPPPSPGSPNKGGQGEGSSGGGGSNNTNIDSPTSTNETTSNAVLIGGIVGGIVVLGAMVFAGLFFYRRRGSKKKAAQEQRAKDAPVGEEES
ncbi:hypothetical protein DFQ26_005195 [Actinomortierella ambigua]|nr:hypothetical protein DFQ26_005195 [Actinomortierella ambigua]